MEEEERLRNHWELDKQEAMGEEDAQFVEQDWNYAAYRNTCWIARSDAAMDSY